MPHITGALLLAVVFMALGIFIKRMWLKNTIVPPSLIAGAIALAVGPQGFGQLLGGADWQPNWLPAGVIPETIIAVWSELPGPLITVVFASLFIGRKIPSVKEIWSESAPNLAYGYSLAFGQYTAGLFIGWAVISTFMDMSAMTGLLIPIGFQGGHGTVAGLQQVLSPIDSAAVDLGYGMATIGIITAAIWGTVVSNLSRKHEHEKEQPDDHLQNDPDEKESERQQSRPSITIPVALIGLAIGIGWLVLMIGDALANSAGMEGDNPISSIVPLFPLAMLAGLALQVLLNRWGNPKCVDRRQASGISDIALSLLVVTALGSLDLQVLGENWKVLLTLGLTGV
jgi:ESS family glutamate:Na+ symporter